MGSSGASSTLADVLVTGGAGFIGSHLVDVLLAQGAHVTVLDDFSTGNIANLRHRAEDPRLRVVRGTVLDLDTVSSLVTRRSVIFHLAAAVGVRNIISNPLGSILTNVKGTEIILNAAFRNDARVLLASTSEIYGRSDQLPFREDGLRVLGPTWTQRWSYSTGKALDEHMAFAYADRGLQVSIARYFNSYGPRIDEKGYGSVIARLAGQALRGDPITVHGDGLQTRCFTYVADTVRGTILVGTRREALGSVFNIGGVHEVTILDLAHRVREILGSRSEIVLQPYGTYYPRGYEDTRRRVPDVSRARDVLGFEALTSLDDGLAATLAWCRDNYQAASERRS